MNIYFSGSIRAGRAFVETFAELIHYISQKPNTKVLTEFVGDTKLSSYGTEHVSDASVYSKDVNLIKNS
jgi:hypothetical protein